MAQAATTHHIHTDWQSQARRTNADHKPVRAVQPRGNKRSERLAALASAFHGGQQKRALDTGIFG